MISRVFLLILDQINIYQQVQNKFNKNQYTKKIFLGCK